MSQTETASETAPSKPAQPPCHIHDKCDDWEKNYIRLEVCVNDEDFTEYEGKHYCLFHLPTINKNVELFNDKFRERLGQVEKAFEDNKTLPEKEQAEKNRNLRYDFRYVWFPSEVNLSRHEFIAAAYFSSATFTAAADFSSATFKSAADFSSATFKSAADFSSATFTAAADFSSATFTATADFSWAKFLETAQIFFNQTSFQKNADFGQAVVKGYLYFEAGNRFFDGWLDEEKLIPKRVERETLVFENRLDFAHVRAEKPERITFNKVRLCPNWFVNIDSRKFVFTDIAWENHHAERKEFKKELISLSRRRYKKPHNYQLLTVAFRNLAANAEEFNRFEEASNFRKSASECERLERLNRQKNWRRKLKTAWTKDILCRRFFVGLYISVSETLRIILREKRPTDAVHFLYRRLSFYGESWSRAFWWLLGIWLIFALAYWRFGEFGTEEKRQYLEFGKSFAYSLSVMTLQRPEPRPLSGVTLLLYAMETILAPLQAALLALAIRRKFIR